MNGTANHFPAKNALDCRTVHTHNFLAVIPSDPRSEKGTTPFRIHLQHGQRPCAGMQAPPGAWIQTPISAWLASVPAVPVLRNDYWPAQLTSGLL